MQTVNVAVISGGLGVPSSSRMLADQLAEATARALADHDIQVNLNVVELREHAMAITNTMTSRYASPEFQEVIDSVTGADAIIAVSPVFTASISGLFKSFFDILEPDSLIGKPVLLGATGGSARHSLVIDYVMRPMFAYLRTLTAPTGVYAAPNDWGRGDENIIPLDDRVKRAATEFANQIMFARGFGPGAQPSAKQEKAEDPQSFESLMSNLAGINVR
ncbi:FMN reductase [Haematomicrobium sanguinis]|uniref:FMN reductase n=1 Tax=Haematomicrobium sanguinis TaxID=479106 RepID=UPI000558094B|nr:FMN reductase [Haematomicrobium sanguinis]